MLKKFIILAALARAASPGAAATIVDTGINPAQKVFTRAVNNDTVLLGQFTIAHGTIIDQILAYGRVVTAGEGRFSIFANQANNTPLLAPYSPGDPDFGAIRTITKSFAVMPKNDYFGVGGTTPGTSLNWALAAGTYWVGVGQAVQPNSFTAAIRGDAPNPLGLEGSIKPKGYVPTNNANLSWQLSGQTIAAAVPEPGTWAMMLVGFGLIGGAIRSGRRRPVSGLARA